MFCGYKKPYTIWIIEDIRINKFSFSQQAKDAYQSIGGTPFLDNGYTVFGEVIEGVKIIDAICAVKTAAGDKPVDPVTILSVNIKRWTYLKI